MGENVGRRPEQTGVGANEAHDLGDAELTDDHQKSDAEAVEAERTGRTNAARDMAADPERGAAPGRWDSIGEPGEGLDELQGLYAADAATRDQLPERGDAPSPATTESPSSARPITPALWDRLTALQGQTIETPKGEPFQVQAVARGERVTVSPLDGGQEWDVPAQELEEAWQAVSQGAELDRLASIRLQEAGVASAHPEYVAGLLRAMTAR